MSISGAIRLIAVLVSSVPVFQGGAAYATHTNSIDGMTDQIKAGIANVVQVVSPRYDEKVESYLRTYLERSRERTEIMIGRSVMYFPMFEKELEAAGLPTDLKYLAVVESALYPQAVSPVGATGLWQFMRPTARECGLYVSKYLDERCDPVKSTRAAIKYLTALYAQFDSWELAMAAYNSGPGRVRYAIRRSGSKDYWKLQRYLPRETRAYVPGFIAASYVLNYYEDHGLSPAFPENDLLETETVTIHTGISFSEVQTVTRVPMEILCMLNPMYVRRYIPQSEHGYTLVLPAYAAVTMEAYLASDKGLVEVTEFEEIETGVELEYVNRLVDEIYFVRAGDNLYNISRNNGCSVDDLKTWNRLSGNTIHIGQQLKIRKMARVLVKVETPPAPQLRQAIHIAPVPTAGKANVGTDRAIGSVSMAPVPLPSRSSMVQEPNTVRRRLSVRHIVPQKLQGQCLTPGSCVN